MARKIVTLNLKRINKDQPWGFRFVGGTDIPLILKVDKVSCAEVTFISG